MTQSTPLKLHQPSKPPVGVRDVMAPWMIRVLQIAGWYNLLAGLGMMVFYHEGFKLLGLAKPEMNLPIQLVGLLVAIFGFGYLIAATNPVENRNLILAGFLSKLLGPCLALVYIAAGKLPASMIMVLFFADLIYLIPFWITYRCGCKLASQQANPPVCTPGRDIAA